MPPGDRFQGPPNESDLERGPAIACRVGEILEKAVTTLYWDVKATIDLGDGGGDATAILGHDAGTQRVSGTAFRGGAPLGTVYVEPYAAGFTLSIDFQPYYEQWDPAPCIGNVLAGIDKNGLRVSAALEAVAHPR